MAKVLYTVIRSAMMRGMKERDLGVYPGLVERHFDKGTERSSIPGELGRQMTERELQLADLAHIQANRPLGRPGTPGWRHAAPPMVAIFHELKRAAEARRRSLA